MSKNNKKRGQYNTELTEKQKAFVENYLMYENATKAYRIAYKQDDENASAVGGHRLMKIDKIKKEIDRRRADINFKGIASPDDLLKFWTNAISDKDELMSNRLKASENMGKYYAMFVERHELNQTTEFQINLGFDAADDRKIIDHRATEYIEHEED